MNLFRMSALTLALVAAGAAQAAPIGSESDPSLAGATLYDFEAGPTGTWTNQSFGDLSVTALAGPDTASPQFSVDGDFAGSYNTRGALHITNHGSEFQAMRFDFAAPVSAFGFLFGASDSTWTLNAYNAGGTLLDTLSIGAVGGSNAGDFFGLSGLSGAAYATVTQVQDGAYANGGVDYVFVDNVRVASAVPEPETYALMLAGLLAVGQVVRRRKAA